MRSSDADDEGDLLLTLFSPIINHKYDICNRNIYDFDSIFKLDYFKTMPKKFGLQGDYYTYDTTKITNDKYIFISDLTDIAVIKINGKDIYLKPDTT